MCYNFKKAQNTTRRFCFMAGKIKNLLHTAKQYWHEPSKGNYIPYKEIASLSGAGFGVHWTLLLASEIALSGSNFLVGASIGLSPMDLQIMLIVANLVGMPIGLFRSWYYDNHNLKGGKFLPFIRRTGLPIVIVSAIFVWLPYEHMEYITKAVVVWFMYMLLSMFLCFYNESYMYFQQIITPNAQERATVMSISQVIYSLAPSISQFLIPFIAGKTWGLENIWTYRVIHPFFALFGIIISTIFFRKVKERLILPKKKPEAVRMLDAIREVAKNKYYWVIQIAAWVGFLESGYGAIFGWSFVYGPGRDNPEMLGVANTLIGNASLWAMLLAPLAIRILGKRNMLIIANSVNVVVLTILYFVYQNIILICVLWYINNFINTFWNIVQHNIAADMRDYHQWKTGVRVDGLFGPLGMIGTVIGFFTGMFYPTIQEHMGLKGDYSVLLDDSIRNNLFEVLIVCSIFGAIFNLIPFFFYDLTENKHRAYVDVLKIRAMFEDYALGEIEEEQLTEAMKIIHTAKSLHGRDKESVKAAPNRKAKKNIRETNRAIERAAIIVNDLEKFKTPAGIARIQAAREDVTKEGIYYYADAKQLMEKAKKLPKNTKTEKEIRSDEIKRARVKKESAALIRKYGPDNLMAPDEKVKEEIINREAANFIDSIKIRRDLKAYLKSVSVYTRAIKPYTDAKNLIAQSEYYENYKEIERHYMCASSAD